MFIGLDQFPHATSTLVARQAAILDNQQVDVAIFVVFSTGTGTKEVNPLRGDMGGESICQELDVLLVHRDPAFPVHNMVYSLPPGSGPPGLPQTRSEFVLSTKVALACAHISGGSPERHQKAAPASPYSGARRSLASRLVASS